MTYNIFISTHEQQQKGRFRNLALMAMYNTSMSWAGRRHLER